MYDEFEKEMMMDEEDELDNAPTGEGDEEEEGEDADSNTDEESM